MTIDAKKALGAFLTVRNMIENQIAHPPAHEPPAQLEEYLRALKVTHGVLEAHIQLLEQHMMGIG